ncbi:Conserved hypothetical protein [gamma proteobacterium HdN1]|nr:Conserved hypothetical protein [gamma proteobacterium HdN1]
MNDATFFGSLTEIEPLLQKQRMPPVERWKPSRCVDVDIRIAADGAWYHEGAVIKRAQLVRLFASILLREGDEFFLVTPEEKARIQVDDAPLLIHQVEFLSAGEGSDVWLSTSTGDYFRLDAEHPLRVVQGDSGEPRPYVRVRRNLEGLVHRNVFYALVEHALASAEDEVAVEQGVRSGSGEEGGSELVIWSAGERFRLGSF